MFNLYPRKFVKEFKKKAYKALKEKEKWTIRKDILRTDANRNFFSMIKVYK